MFSTLTELAVRQCIAQGATRPEDYVNMGKAMQYANETYGYGINFRFAPLLHTHHIARLLGFSTRHVNLMFPRDAADHKVIPRRMETWGLAVSEGRLTADEAYKEFEEIHPYIDGNGRTGHIIWLWMNNFRKLEMPPQYWG